MFGMIAGASAPSERFSRPDRVYRHHYPWVHMSTATHFYILAALVGMVQGGRRHVALAVRQHDSAPQVRRVLWIFSVFNKFAGIFGRCCSRRYRDDRLESSGDLSVIAFFALEESCSRRNVRVGERAARDAERRLVTNGQG